MNDIYCEGCQVASNNFSEKIICKGQACKNVSYWSTVKNANYVLKNRIIFYY